MKKKFPLPLIIDCEGLSRNRMIELVGRLKAHFVKVDFSDEEITAEDPLDLNHYHAAWSILDAYGVKVT